MRIVEPTDKPERTGCGSHQARLLLQVQNSRLAIRPSQPDNDTKLASTVLPVLLGKAVPTEPVH
jgi:hypothetical protein